MVSPSNHGGQAYARTLRQAQADTFFTVMTEL